LGGSVEQEAHRNDAVRGHELEIVIVPGKILAGRAAALADRGEAGGESTPTGFVGRPLVRWQVRGNDGADPERVRNLHRAVEIAFQDLDAEMPRRHRKPVFVHGGTQGRRIFVSPAETLDLSVAQRGQEAEDVAPGLEVT